MPDVTVDREDCPCGTGRAYSSCCGPIHQRGAGLGMSAESLMRARYVAYVQERDDFLLSSWHPDTRPTSIGSPAIDQQWIDLEVIDVTGGGALDSSGTVTFKARFRRGEEFFELHERSTFERVEGRWLYVDGVEPG